MSYLGSNTAATSSAINDEDIVPTTVDINVEDSAPDDEEKMKPNAAETFSTILWAWIDLNHVGFGYL